MVDSDGRELSELASVAMNFVCAEEFLCGDTDEVIEVDMQALCRICGGVPDVLVPIFEAEGNKHNLHQHIQQYLPIVTILEADFLPQKVCVQCVHSILAWHDLVVNCIDTNKKLREMIVSEEAGETPQESIKIESIESFPNEQDECLSLKLECSLDEEHLSPQQIEYLHDEDENNVEILEENQDNDENDDDDEDEADESQIKLENSSDQENSDSIYKTHNEKYEMRLQEDSEEKENELVQKVATSRYSGGNQKKRQRSTITKDGLYKCGECKLEYTDRHKFSRHLRAKHKFDQHMSVSKPIIEIDKSIIERSKVVIDDKLYYECGDCKKKLMSATTFIWHLRIHSGEKPFVCDLCGKRFRIYQGVSRHIKETHEQQRDFPCDICGRKFGNRRNVAEHRRLHTGERPYVCDTCGKSFKQKASLFVHKRSHQTTFAYHCSHCDAGFRTRPPMLLHETIHTGERPHQCDICGRKFRVKHELNRHKMIHSELKQFKCTECNHWFRQKRYLLRHCRAYHPDSVEKLVDAAVAALN